MFSMWDFFAKPFGALMEFIYFNLAFQNYGVAIIIFTLFVKILLLPLSVKQQRSMEKQQALQPELEALKNKYKDDPRNKQYQEEQMALYSKHKINPYGGCLPMLLQFPLIIIVYQIIRRPLTYVAGLAGNVISSLAGAYTGAGAGEAFVRTWSNNEITINNFFLGNTEKFYEIAGQSANLINMKFMGIFDLGITPRWQFWSFGDEWKTYLPLMLIPVLAVVSSYVQMWLTNRINNGPKKKGEKKETVPGLGSVVKIMPLMTLFIGFMVPAGLGFYWIVSNVFGVLQTLLIKKMFNSKKGVV